MTTPLLFLLALVAFCFVEAGLTLRAWRMCTVDDVALVTIEQPLASKLNSGELGALLVVHPLRIPVRHVQRDPGVPQ